MKVFLAGLNAASAVVSGLVFLKLKDPSFIAVLNCALATGAAVICGLAALREKK